MSFFFFSLNCLLHQWMSTVASVNHIDWCLRYTKSLTGQLPSGWPLTSASTMWVLHFRKQDEINKLIKKKKTGWIFLKGFYATCIHNYSNLFNNLYYKNALFSIKIVCSFINYINMYLQMCACIYTQLHAHIQIYI